jgi:hypothetical protein
MDHCQAMASATFGLWSIIRHSSSVTRSSMAVTGPAVLGPLAGGEGEPERLRSSWLSLRPAMVTGGPYWPTLDAGEAA